MPSRAFRVARSVQESIPAAQSGKETMSRRTASKAGHHPSSPSLRVFGPLPPHARNLESTAQSCPTLGPCAKLLAPTLNPSIYRPNCGGSVPSHPQPVRKPLNKASNSYSSLHIHVALGGRPQAASLVQGLRPRNAPLQNRASPTVCLHRNVSAGEHGGGCIPVASPKT